MTIWEKHFVQRWLKVFFLFFLLTFGLYVVIDYSSHTGNFHHHQTVTAKTVIVYYLSEAIKRAEILIPFGVLIATIRVLTQLSAHNELVALLASGIKMKRLLRPFLLLGLILVASLYINYEFFLPQAIRWQRPTEKLEKLHKKRSQKYPLTRQLALEDGSLLVFYAYNSKAFEDVYWIPNSDEIYHMETLNPYTSPPLGKTVNHFTRHDEGLSLEVSQAVREFPELILNHDELIDTFASADEESLSALSQGKSSLLSEKDAKRLTLFHRRLAMPLLSLFAILIPAPFCLHFRRLSPLYLIYGLALFALITTILLINAMTILGERQVIAPQWTLWPFFALLTIWGGRKWLKLQ
ncbi:MAG: LptF/LptG family permease [Chlamydiia bacterium]|nr:LptF/LptG family permease [Chlamydiia bacterium]